MWTITPGTGFSQSQGDYQEPVLTFLSQPKGPLGGLCRKQHLKCHHLELDEKKHILIQQETMDVLSQDNQRGMREIVLFLSYFCPCLLYDLEILTRLLRGCKAQTQNNGTNSTKTV